MTTNTGVLLPTVILYNNHCILLMESQVRQKTEAQGWWACAWNMISPHSKPIGKHFWLDTTPHLLFSNQPFVVHLTTQPLTE